jgi:hypothetical protein
VVSLKYVPKRCIATVDSSVTIMNSFISSPKDREKLSLVHMPQIIVSSERAWVRLLVVVAIHREASEGSALENRVHAALR